MSKHLSALNYQGVALEAGDTHLRARLAAWQKRVPTQRYSYLCGESHKQLENQQRRLARAQGVKDFETSVMTGGARLDPACGVLPAAGQAPPWPSL